MGIRLGAVVLQLGIIDDDDAVGTVLRQFIRKAFDLIADQNRGDFLFIEIRRKLFCLAKKFERNIGKLVVYLLSVDKYALVIF